MEDDCALCGKGRKSGEDFRDVRNIHVHWARMMELCCPRHYLSEWTTRKAYYSNLPRIKLEKHFKCFTHEELHRTFSQLNSGKRCHKHCLHAFNFSVKVRFDQWARDTNYTGPKPDFIKFGKTDLPVESVCPHPADTEAPPAAPRVVVLGSNSGAPAPAPSSSQPPFPFPFAFEDPSLDPVDPAGLSGTDSASGTREPLLIAEPCLTMTVNGSRVLLSGSGPFVVGPPPLPPRIAASPGVEECKRVWVRGVPPLISASSGPSAFVIRVDLSADVYRLQLVYEDPSRPLPHLEYSAGGSSSVYLDGRSIVQLRGRDCILAGSMVVEVPHVPTPPPPSSSASSGGSSTRSIPPFRSMPASGPSYRANADVVLGLASPTAVPAIRAAPVMKRRTTESSATDWLGSQIGRMQMAEEPAPGGLLGLLLNICGVPRRFGGAGPFAIGPLKAMSHARLPMPNVHVVADPGTCRFFSRGCYYVITGSTAAAPGEPPKLFYSIRIQSDHGRVPTHHTEIVRGDKRIMLQLGQVEGLQVGDTVRMGPFDITVVSLAKEGLASLSPAPPPTTSPRLTWETTLLGAFPFPFSAGGEEFLDDVEDIWDDEPG